MFITIANKQHNLYCLYNGKTYAFWNDYFGVIAHAIKLERLNSRGQDIYADGYDWTTGDNEERKVKITIEYAHTLVCYDLKGVISRTIRKLETQYIDRAVELVFVPREDYTNAHFIDFEVKNR